MPSLMAILGLDASGFHTNLEGASRHGESVGGKLKEVFGEAISSQLEKFASVAAVEEAIRQTMEYAEQVRKFSVRTGESTDRIQEWAYAGSKVNVELESIVNGFEKMQVAMAKANAGGAAGAAAFGALTRLGLSREQISNLSEAGRNFEIIGDRIKNAEVNGQMLKDILLAFGKAGREIIPVFKNDLADAAEEARKIGSVMKPEAIAQAAEASERLKMAWYSLRPLVAEVVGWASRRIMDMADFFRLTIGLLVVDFQARREASTKGQAFVDWAKENAQPGRSEAASNEAFARKTRNEYIDKILKERQLREEQLQKMESTLRGGEPHPPYEAGEAAGGETKKAEELEQKLFELQQKRYLESLSKEAQVNELVRRRIELEQFIAEHSKEMDDEHQKQAAVDLEEARLKEDEAKRTYEREKALEEKKSMHAFTAPQVTAHQRVGAYSTPQENALVTHAAKSEAHLAKIKEHMQTLVDRRGPGPVKFG